ncbi:MAG: transporter substrate-binding domain-containing protein, partial [Gammaproteobacteria bacterium]|nr:transporter substrate-binding domain-containing protein [Gammaproteobacteria bacterium]
TLNQKRIAYNILDPNIYGVPFYDLNLFSSEAFTTANPKTTAAFVAASNQGWRYALEHPEEIVDLILKKYDTQGKSREHLLFEAKAIRRVMQPEVYPVGSIDPVKVSKIQEAFVQNGFGKKVVDPMTFIFRVERDPGIELTLQQQAWLAAHPVIRVSNESDWPPINFAEKGKPKGYSIDYMNLLAKRLGIQVDYVTGSTWDEFMGMIKKGDLDVILNIVNTPERRKYIHFTKSYMELPDTIFSRKGGKSFPDFDALSGYTVAVPKGFSIQEYIETHNPDIKLQIKDDLPACIKAVSFGQADALIDYRLVVEYIASRNFVGNLVATGEIHYEDGSASSLTIGTPKDRAILRDILQRAMDSVGEEELQPLRQKWMGMHASASLPKDGSLDAIELTDREKAWIADHPTIEIAINNQWPPMDYVDQDGQPHGIGVDFIQALNQRLGGILRIVPGSWKQIYGDVKSGKLPALMDITPRENRKPLFNFTHPYIKVPHTIFAHNDDPGAGSLADLTSRTVALEKGFFRVTALRDEFPDIKVQEHATTLDALHAVSKGEADAYIGNRAVAIHSMREALI